MKQILPIHLGQSKERAHYVPDYTAKSVQDIDFTFLHEKGIRCVALDIDNTLVAHGAVELDLVTQQFLQNQKESGVIEKLAIATNRSEKNLRRFIQKLEPDALIYASGLRRKPRASYFEHLLGKLECSADETVMIGDKLLQDIYGGNRAGLTTILVEPLGPSAWFDRLLLLRWREKRILRSFKQIPTAEEARH